MAKHPSLQAADQKVEAKQAAVKQAMAELTREQEARHALLVSLVDQALGTNHRHYFRFPTAIIEAQCWDCEDSPSGKCVYNLESDAAQDQCLFCGLPWERK